MESTSSKLQILVEGPEKVGVGIMDTHVEYKIQVKTLLKNYKTNEFSVLRRYKHFDALREELKEKFKGHLIPPLPEKTVLNRFNVEFIEFRRRELQKFLERIIAHPVLSQSEELKIFLESENIESVFKPPPKEYQNSGGFLSYLSSSLSTQIESLSQNFGTQKEPDQWFDAQKNYILALEIQLTSVEKATTQLLRKQKELNQAYSDLGLASSLLSSTEADHDESLSTSFQEISELCCSLTSLNEVLIKNETIQFEDTLRDYLRIISAVKEMLSARNEKLILYQNQSKQKEEKNKISNKIEKDSKDIPSKTETDFKAISDTCKEELSLMKAKKSEDFKKMLIDFVKMNLGKFLL